jgi:hypothetical protein
MESTITRTIARSDSKGTYRNTLTIAAGCCSFLTLNPLLRSYVRFSPFTFSAATEVVGTVLHPNVLLLGKDVLA